MLSMTKVVLLVMLGMVLFQDVNGIVCTKQICASKQCEPVSAEECSGPNQVIRLGGFCSCCNVCYTNLGENEKCSVLVSALRGAPPPVRGCAEGLLCQEGRCQSIKTQ